jgi:endonuclease/exonuclease/phosphatase family metal-dependent hydrolase
VAHPLTIRLETLPRASGYARRDLEALATALDQAIPAKTFDRNLLIATWNIRRFGSLSERWRSGEEHRPKRDWLGAAAIAEIVARFDVVAIQEVCGDLRALACVMALLGPHWGYLMTDVNAGPAGDGERMAFVFDRRRLHLAGLAAELAIPSEDWARITPDSFRDQFARAPYAVSFETSRTRFVLVTLHINYGKPNEGRLDELHATAAWLAKWSRGNHGHGTNVLALGDFNIDRHGDALWQAFTSTGLVVPEALHEVPRSVFATHAKALTKYYDQIAWFRPRGSRRLGATATSAGSFDFLPHVYLRPALTPAAISYRISDHYPLWVELREAASPQR